LLARVANGMTGLLAVFVTWHATFTLWRDRRLANAAALILALSPPAVALTAWVNNDQLMILLGAALLTASAASPSPKSYGTLVGVSLLATMTKLTGIVALPFSALVILAYEFRRGTRRVLPALAGVFVVAGAYIAWNYANCGLPLCRIYRREHYFEGWISFFYYLGRPPYGESLIQLARTSTIPIIHNTILPDTWVVFGGMTVFLIGLCGVGIHWIANRRQSRLGGLLLLIGLALALVWVRIWWFPWSAFLPARYLSLIFAAIAILSARGWLSLGDLLPYRWRWWPLLIPIGWLGWTLISTPTLYYTPMTTPQLATSPSEHLIEAELGGINVVGYTLTQTDDYTRISLNLHSPTPTNIPLYAFVLLQNEVGIPIDTCGQVLGTAAYPSSLWQPDAIVRQTFDFMPVDDPTALEVQLYEIQQLNDLQSTYDPTRQVGTVKIPLRLLSE
jgi:4-amino-4-deoxy-L-arabinose transferase-like glycosyltransferase